MVDRGSRPEGSFLLDSTNPFRLATEVGCTLIILLFGAILFKLNMFVKTSIVFIFFNSFLKRQISTMSTLH